MTQAARVRELKREQARLQGMLGELIARKAQAEGLITEIEIETFKIGSTRRETAISHLRDQHYREMELTEQRRALKEQLAQLEIKAPVSGIVYGLQVFALRAVIRAAEPVLYIVPQDRPLVVAAQVAPIYIDQLSIGQAVFCGSLHLTKTSHPNFWVRSPRFQPTPFKTTRRGDRITALRLL